MLCKKNYFDTLRTSVLYAQVNNTACLYSASRHYLNISTKFSPLCTCNSSFSSSLTALLSAKRINSISFTQCCTTVATWKNRCFPFSQGHLLILVLTAVAKVAKRFGYNFDINYFNMPAQLCQVVVTLACTQCPH